MLRLRISIPRIVFIEPVYGFKIEGIVNKVILQSFHLSSKNAAYL